MYFITHPKIQELCGTGQMQNWYKLFGISMHTIRKWRQLGNDKDAIDLVPAETYDSIRRFVQLSTKRLSTESRKSKYILVATHLIL